MSGSILLVLRLLLTLALYAFLGWALLTLWRDLQQQSRSLSRRQVPPISLKQQAEKPLAPYLFDRPEVTIGRDLSNDICIDDKTVSARHARLFYRQAQWWVEDLRSTNGTFVNSEQASAAMVLASGDELRCGQVIFMVSIGEE